MPVMAVVMHMNIRNLLLLLIFLCQPALAENNYYSDLDGYYFIWGDPIDKNNSPGVEGVTLVLTGDAAKRLFIKAEAKAHYNECIDNGTLTKYIGNIECNESPNNEYSCSFSINTKDQKVYRAEPC